MRPAGRIASRAPSPGPPLPCEFIPGGQASASRFARGWRSASPTWTASSPSRDGDIYDLLDLLGRNIAAIDSTPLVRWSFALQRILRWLEQYNPIGRAQRNVAHHYDLNDQLYDFFLDRDRQYSCAYFTTPGESLEQAQIDKKHHIAAKLLLKPGQRVLDIGSGWGGMGLFLSPAVRRRRHRRHPFQGTARRLQPACA